MITEILRQFHVSLLALLAHLQAVVIHVSMDPTFLVLHVFHAQIIVKPVIARPFVQVVSVAPLLIQALLHALQSVEME